MTAKKINMQRHDVLLLYGQSESLISLSNIETIYVTFLITLFFSHSA